MKTKTFSSETATALDASIARAVETEATDFQRRNPGNVDRRTVSVQFAPTQSSVGPHGHLYYYHAMVVWS